MLTAPARELHKLPFIVKYLETKVQVDHEESSQDNGDA